MATVSALREGYAELCARYMVGQWPILVRMSVSLDFPAGQNFVVHTTTPRMAALPEALESEIAAFVRDQAAKVWTP